MLELYAGKTALNTIKENGLTPDLFTSFLGASGGPKWFTLFGLDKYIFGEFFKGRTKPLNIVGSSAGAFRAACFAQDDPVKAIETLAHNYAETVYSAKATPQEITSKAHDLLDVVFANGGDQQVINNSIMRAHFIVAKAKGLVASESKSLQAIGLIKSMLLNRVNRSQLKGQYQRYIFQNSRSDFAMHDEYQFETYRELLNQDNIHDALMASGAIPMVMEGIPNIAHAPKGMYRDGGIIDYHFDIKIENDGLVLYPHFNRHPKAGWFDKSLARKVDKQNYDKILFLCPSQKFIDSLPYGKIPDRNDFTELTADVRIKYWKEVFVRTEELAAEFKEVVDKQILDRIQPFTG